MIDIAQWGIIWGVMVIPPVLLIRRIARQYRRRKQAKRLPKWGR